MEDKFEKSTLDDKEAKGGSIQDTGPVLNKDILKEYVGIQEKEKSSNFKDRLEFYLEQFKENITNNITLQELKYFWTPKRIAIVVGAISIVFVVFYLFALVDVQKMKTASQYRLVPEKLSKSAVIRISVPKDMEPDTAKKAISFEPSINGKWIEKKSSSLVNLVFAAEEKKMIYFKPDNELSVNRHYQVRLNLGEEKSMKADFLAVEDPMIEAVFPDDKEEALESSAITIAFNRPMVSFEDGTQNNTSNIPVEIFPETRGNFVWMSPSVLQFQPRDGLIPSMDYTVKVKDGFVSIDDLKVKGGEFRFKTRTLKYLDLAQSDRKVVYNQPIKIYFNQEVDIKKIASEITLYGNGQKSAFLISYGSRDGEVANSLTDTVGNVIADVSANIDNLANGVGYMISGDHLIDSSENGKDKSVIEIYNKKDRFNNDKLWNEGVEYSVLINKAYPSKGNISLEERREIKFSTSSIVKGVFASSPRTTYASLDMFDPQGQVVIDFYEDINLGASKIDFSIPVSSINYGEVCANGELNMTNCPKAKNKKQLRINFDSTKIGVNVKANLVLKSIVSARGGKINSSDISYSINTYSPLSVAIGRDKSKSNHSTLILCSNNPLTIPEVNDLRNHITADAEYEVFGWGISWMNQYYENNYCPIGQFVTPVEVGFIPEKRYSLGLLVEDVFGQSVEKGEEIVIDKADDSYSSLFPVQGDYNITSPKNTAVTFAAKNMDYVDVEICKKYDAYSFYDAYLKKEENKGNLISNCKEVGRKEGLNLSTKRWITEHFDIDIKDYFKDETIGNYVIRVSNRDYKGKDGDDGIYAFLTVTNIAVSERRVDLTDAKAEENSDIFGEIKNIYWVTNMETQEPIEGAVVKIYSSGKIVESVSNKDGIAFVTPVPNFDIIAVEYGRDSTVITKDDNLNDVSHAYSVNKAYIYTDKSLYKPEEVVNIKGVLRIGYDGNYKSPSREMEFKIFNPKNEQIYMENMPLSEYGTLANRYLINKNAPLGKYSVCVTDFGCGYFTVTEDVTPAFEIVAIPQKEEFVSREDIGIDLEAKYYFGVPVENGEVEYTISATDYYFDRYKEGKYDFMNEDIERLDEEVMFKKGSTKLDIYGRGTIKENVDIGQVFRDSNRSKILHFDISIRSSFGQTVSYRKSVILHQGDFYIGSQMTSYFMKKNQKLGFRVKTVGYLGKGVEVKDMNADIYKIEWVRTKKYNSDGSSYYYWEKKRNHMSNIKLSMSRGGDFSRTRDNTDPEGEYEIEFYGNDSHGNKVYSKLLYYIFGDNQVQVRAEDTASLNLRAITPEINLTEEAEMVIESPYQKAKALLTIERGRIFEYQIIEITNGLYNYKFKPKGTYFPNVYVSVLLLGPNSEVRFATQEFTIESTDSNLNIQVKAEKSRYLPGEEVEIKIRTMDGKFSPTPAEVSLAIISNDLPKDVKNVDKDPFTYFYHGFPLSVSAYSNIKGNMDKRKKQVSLSGDTKEGEEKMIKSLVLWKADVVTDQSGYHDLTFRAPQILGNWRIEALGVNKKSNVGVAYAEFITRKELMVVPIRPKFVIPGDKFYVGAEIFNQTDKKKTVKASFESSTLAFLGSNKETLLNIEAGNSQTVYFFVEAPFAFLRGRHGFVVNADIQDSDSLVSCSAQFDDAKVRGKCGEANGKKFLEKPTENLCAVGIPTELSGDGPWNWVCNGLNGGRESLACKASKNDSVTDGRCGASSKKKSAFPPEEKLCLTGTPSEVLGFGMWTWTCEGANGGKSISCNAPRDETKIEGECGKSHNKLLKEKPTEKLCVSGQASEVNESWSWTCEGANGGASEECAAKKSNDSKNQCGAANGKKFYFMPTENLCLVGSPSEVSGEGPWTWTCGDSRASAEEFIDVKEDASYDLVSVSGSTDENKRNEVIFIPGESSSNKGELSIRTSPNLSVFLSDSLNYLVNYPYLSSEQLASKMKAILISGNGLQIVSIFEKFKVENEKNQDAKYSLKDEIEQGLAKLFNKRNHDGGFSLWGGRDSDFRTSLSVLDAMIVLHDNEYISKDKENEENKNFISLVDYVYNQAFKSEKDDIEKQISAAYILTRTEKYKKDGVIKDKLEKLLKDDALMKDRLSHQSLLKLAILVEGGGFSWGLDGKMEKLVKSIVSSDSKGVFVEPKSSMDDGTAVSNTAMYLKYLAVAKKESDNDKVIQWLINSRSGDGSWGSTRDTVDVIDAFVSHLQWKRAKDSNYELVINLNDKKLESFNFDSGTNMDQTSKKINITELKHNDYNVIGLDKSKHRPLFKDYLYYDITFKQYYSNNLAPKDEGLAISRSFYSLNDPDSKNPLSSATMGNIVRVRFEVVVPKERKHLTIEDYIPAGMEIVDIGLATERNYLRNMEKGVKNDYLYPDFKEMRDDRAFIYKESVQPGVYHFDYYVRAATRGVYNYLPSIVSESYNPSVFGKTGSSIFEIK
ncbi:MAG: hypothetical protein MNSN_03250 [Minisyncoccus archaeiphilus]|uniref:alpha-2-macroglobulin family protein n=1 Tax=Minisyncoccus archaeiphilus TaxID=3238481 RepID=UPI002B0974FE|nr:MAG: hypothetical protein MNSN_03250 [Candidatus Parcubacteria bacterium]